MIITGDCLEEMRKMDAESVTAIVTDPPYALEFMGKGWDKVLPTEEVWREALRLVKPGGLLLAFGGTRTYHRLTCSIEDAGWLIRDCVMWMYGSGFPKSLDISKAIDKAAGAEREVIGKMRAPATAKKGTFNCSFDKDKAVITTPATDAAKTWSGYGTALKPAWEPIVVAMKPCSGTFAQNALEHGVAGINVDGGRIELEEGCRLQKGGSYSGNRSSSNVKSVFNAGSGEIKYKDPPGRFPANVIIDEEAGAMLDEQRRFFYCAKASKKERNAGLDGMPVSKCGVGALRDGGRGKTSPNNHPTVKPLALMRYLVRLVTMPSDTVILDPFMGSGSTGVACREEGVDFIGIERDPKYAEIAKRRVG